MRPEEPMGEALRANSQWLFWWADLLKRVLALEVLACARGGRRRMLAVIKDERVARQILEHLGLPSQAPPLGRATPEPQSELWPRGPPLDDTA